MTDRDDDTHQPSTRWGDVLVASPWRMFVAVLGVALVVEAGQGLLRAMVLPDLSGWADFAVDLLWLPTLLGLLLWRAVVKPLHNRLAGEVEEIRRAESTLRDRTERLEFDGQLRRALETVEDEAAVRSVVDRATRQAAPDARTRLLLATDDEVGAVCHPITILGETRGVLTTSFGAHDVLDEAAQSKLESVAARTGSRLSLVRALADSRRQATTDALTGLVNRRALLAAHDRARVQGDGPSLLLCDLDHFKQLNDTHGHEAGDTALVAFADVLRAAVRPEDVPARIGGEEFAVLLPDTTLDEAMVVAERVRETQAANRGGRPSTTVSIGVTGPEAGQNLEDLLRAADAALYAAKEAGRNTVVAAQDDGTGGSVSPLRSAGSGGE